MRRGNLGTAPCDVHLAGDMRMLDSLAFLLVIFWARKLKIPGLKFRTILDTVAEDSTCYFLIVFTSHFVLVLTLNLGRVSAIILLP